MGYLPDSDLLWTEDLTKEGWDTTPPPSLMQTGLETQEPNNSSTMGLFGEEGLCGFLTG